MGGQAWPLIGPEGFLLGTYSPNLMWASRDRFHASPLSFSPPPVHRKENDFLVREERRRRKSYEVRYQYPGKSFPE